MLPSHRRPTPARKLSVTSSSSSVRQPPPARPLTSSICPNNHLNPRTQSEKSKKNKKKHKKVTQSSARRRQQIHRCVPSKKASEEIMKNKPGLSRNLAPNKRARALAAVCLPGVQGHVRRCVTVTQPPRPGVGTKGSRNTILMQSPSLPNTLSAGLSARPSLEDPVPDTHNKRLPCVALREAPVLLITSSSCTPPPPPPPSPLTH